MSVGRICVRSVHVASPQESVLEAARRMPRDLSDTFAKAGFYRMCVPEQYGGLELPPAITMETIETVARWEV